MVGWASRVSPVGSVVAAISGLGTVFLAKGIRARLRRGLVIALYRVALGKRRLAVIFQNEADRSLLSGQARLSPDKVHLIPGSGVSMTEFPYCPEPDGWVRIIMAARLLVDKGVRDFVQACRELRHRNLNVDCVLVGEPDPGNPNTISEEEFRQWQAEGIVECTGFRTDISDLFSRSHIVVLPSYYGEGLPKVLVEAAACGRAVVTTDHPGCRDAIIPGKTGLLVPVGQPERLADTLQYLVQNPELRVGMGRAGRQLAEQRYAIGTIVARHMEIYRELLND